MKRLLVVGGSVGVVFLLVLAMFPTVIAINTINADIQSINSEKNTLELLNNFNSNILDYPPGWWLGVLRDILISFIIWFSMTFLR